MPDAQVLSASYVTEDTSTSTTWVDTATIPAASFTANKEYLIVAIMALDGASNASTGKRLVHGTTPTAFTDADSTEEYTGSDARWTDVFLTRFTQPGTTEAVTLQFNRKAGTATITHMFSVIIAIKLSDDFTENTDFFWQELTTDNADAASFTNRAAVTLSANGSDRWLLIGQVCWDSNTTGVEHHLRIQDSVGPTNYGDSNYLSKDVTDVYNMGYWVAFVPTNASHTFTLQTQSGTGTTVLSSRIVAINLAKFAQSTSAYTAAGSTPATAPTWTTEETLSPTPDATGNWVILANGLVASLVGDNCVSRLQINPDGSGLVSDPAYGDDAPDRVNSSNTQYGPFQLMTVRSLSSGASRPINFDWTKDAGTPSLKETALIAFSVALVGAAADPAFLPEIVEAEAAFDDTLHDFVFWLTPADVVVVEEMPAIGVLDADETTDDTDVHGFVFWLLPENVEDFQPLAEWGEAGTADFSDVADEEGWLWAALEDVVVVEDMPPIAELADLAEDAEAADASWLVAVAVEEIVEDFQALPVLVESVAVYDDSLYQWSAWPLPAELPVEDFLPLAELEEVAIAFDDTPFNWMAGPNSLSGLPGFTLGLVRVTSTVKGMVVTIGVKAAKVTTKYKGTRDGTTQ